MSAGKKKRENEINKKIEPKSVLKVLKGRQMKEMTFVNCKL